MIKALETNRLFGAVAPITIRSGTLLFAKEWANDVNVSESHRDGIKVGVKAGR